MIPLRDVIPSRTVPFLTVTIIILNGIAWFYELGLPSEELPLFLQQFGVVLAYFTLPTIGASGAIAGVMGAYFVLYPQSRVLTLIPLIVFWEIVELPAIFLLGFWFLMQLFSAGAIAATANSQAGGVAFMAHVAGFLTGLVGVFIFRKRQPD